MARRAQVITVVVTLCLMTLCSAQRDYLFNLTDPEYLDPGEDNALVKLPDGIPLGATGSEDTVIIWRNGLVTLGDESLSADLKIPMNFSAVTASYLLAPLWFPNINTELVNTTVTWDQEVAQSGKEDGYILEFASDAVRNYSLQHFGLPTEFKPTWAMIVNWNVSLISEICERYYNCQCQATRASGSGSESELCDPEQCYNDNEWSVDEVEYIGLLCGVNRNTDFYYYFDYRTDFMIQFQLVLATDGDNTQAVFLYQCGDYYYSYHHYNIYSFYSQASVGYRLGRTYFNDSCISSQLLSLFSYYNSLRCDSIIDPNYYNRNYYNRNYYRVRALLYNLTDSFSHFQYLDPGKDYALVKLKEGIPLGATGNEDTVFIWRNGLVTFGVQSLSADLKIPTRNYSAVTASYLLAPLWFPNINTELVKTTVIWDQEVAQSGKEDGYILEFASDAVRNYSLQYFGLPTEFKPTWAMIINWNVSLVPEESFQICERYYKCQCENYTGSGNGSGPGKGSGSCAGDTDQCYTDNGWSVYDVEYIILLCGVNRYDNNNYYYYRTDFMFQLVLATDGEDTHAVFLYQCSQDYYYHYDVYSFIYNKTSVGYRLGSTSFNASCISSQLPSLLRCYSSLLGCDSIFDPPDLYDYSLRALFYNLTDSFSQFQYLAYLEEGVDYIPFQFQLDNLTIPVTFLSRQLDGASGPIIHPVGIGVGTTTQTNIYVGTNGIISFGRPYYFWYPQRFPTRYPWIRDTYVAAPFWHDVDIRDKGDVLHYVLDSKNPAAAETFENINKFLQFQMKITFKAEWMLLALWAEVPVYPHYYIEQYPNYYSDSFKNAVLNDFNTFEAIIVSSGPDTYAIFTYNCELLTNPGAYRKAVVGYNLGGFDFMNDVYSESFVANRIACRHWPSSNWYNLIYKLNAGQNEILQAQRTCRGLVAADEKAFSAKDIAAYETVLSPCPCSIFNAWRDRNYRWDSENFFCYYRRFPNPRTGNFDQYCCYDFNFGDGTWGSLVKSGYRVSGMANLVQEEDQRSLSPSDIELRRICCGLAGLCDLYLKRRPPNDCTGYDPPVWTWGWGDPHITTLDGVSYTFNGYGEYVLLRYTGEFMLELQARMRPTPGTSATEFSSFAIGHINGSRVEVDCSDPDPFCKTRYNSTDISDQLTAVNDSFYSSSAQIEVFRETETTVTVVFGVGITLAVTYNSSARIPNFQLTLDPMITSNGTMEGLLGSKDDNPNNDLIGQNETNQLDIDDYTDQEIFDFGNTWRIMTLGDSLFSYEDGKGPADFYNESWVPSFTSDVLNSATPAVQDSCTPEGASQPLEQCVFDAVVTGDISVGMATMDTLNENMLAMAESTNLPPVISSEGDTIQVNLSVSVAHSVSVSDDTDTVPLSLVSFPSGSSVSPGQPGSYTFTWAFSGLEEEDEVLPLVFSATDSLGATGTFTLRLEVCACRNGGNCTLEGVVNPSADVVIMNCICPPAWDGRYCQWDVDGCLEFACLAGVECIDVPAPGEGAECGPCPTGYTDDGDKCADLDECVLDGMSSCQQVCTNTEGSFECSCNPGYVVDPSAPNRCVDIDECVQLLAGCDQTCTNTEGSFECSCGEGFTSDGTSCTPDIPCTSGACGIAPCATVNGKDVCYCDGGYELNADGNGCIDVDECGLNLCEHNCTNFPGIFVCSCRDGYVLGPDRQSCVDIDECLLQGLQFCQSSEVCANEDGGYTCVCPPGQYRVPSDGSSFRVCAAPAVDDRYADHSITATFTTVTETELLDGGRIDRLSGLVESSVRQFCSNTRCKIETGNEAAAVRKRLVSVIYNSTADSIMTVFDLEGVVSVQGGVSMPFYVEVVTSDGVTGVLNGEDTLAALEESSSDFETDFGGAVFFSLTNNPPLSPSPSPSPSTSPSQSPSPSLSLSPSPSPSPSPPATESDDEEEKKLSVALVAGVTVAAALLFAVSLASILYFCIEWLCKKNSNSDKRVLLTERVSMPDGKGSGASEMKAVPPPPNMTEDPGRTVVVNPFTA